MGTIPHDGGIINGIDDSSNLTVLEAIKEDAIGYKLSVPDLFADALNLYAGTVNSDLHTEVLDLISNISQEDIPMPKNEPSKSIPTEREGFSHLKERAPTFGISCSSDYLAYRDSCSEVLRRMSQDRNYIGGRRSVYSFGSCHLRVGPHTRTGDVSFYTAHSVARLIEEHCARVPCCGSGVKVSGYSPKNGGHRKICLSSKRNGCY